MFETTNQFESLKIDRLMSFLLRNQLWGTESRHVECRMDIIGISCWIRFVSSLDTLYPFFFASSETVATQRIEDPTTACCTSRTQPGHKTANAPQASYLKLKPFRDCCQQPRGNTYRGNLGVCTALSAQIHCIPFPAHGIPYALYIYMIYV